MTTTLTYSTLLIFRFHLTNLFYRFLIGFALSALQSLANASNIKSKNCICPQFLLNYEKSKYGCFLLFKRKLQCPFTYTLPKKGKLLSEYLKGIGQKIFYRNIQSVLEKIWIFSRFYDESLRIKVDILNQYLLKLKII